MKFLRVLKNVLAIIGFLGCLAILWTTGAIEKDLFTFKQEVLLAVTSLAMFGGGVLGSIALGNEIEYRKGTRR